MNDIFSIKNKIIIITGAGRGIGGFLAEKLHENGAIVYALDLKFELKRKKEKYFQIKCDITNEKNMKMVIDKIFKNEKQIDVLINNAGVTFPEKNEKEYKKSQWEKTLNVNLTGAFVCSLITIHYMKKIIVVP